MRDVEAFRTEGEIHTTRYLVQWVDMLPSEDGAPAGEPAPPSAHDAPCPGPARAAPTPSTKRTSTRQHVRAPLHSARARLDADVLQALCKRVDAPEGVDFEA